MDALSGIGGLGLQQPPLLLGGMPPAAPACPACGAPLDCFSPSPELAESAAHPWLGGGGGLGFDPASLFDAVPPGLDLGGGSLANQAAALQAMSVDQNLANSALIGAEAHGLKSGTQAAQIW